MLLGIPIDDCGFTRRILLWIRSDVGICSMLADQVRFEELTDDHLRQALLEGRAIIVFEEKSPRWQRVPRTGPSVINLDPQSPSRRLQRPFEICVRRVIPSDFDQKFQEVAERVATIRRKS
jgi:hypothetical protein